MLTRPVGQGDPLVGQRGHRHAPAAVDLADPQRGQRSVELDLASVAGREALLRLTESADVLIESFGPGVTDKLGIDFEAVRARSPRIVYASVSAFGDGELGVEPGDLPNALDGRAVAERAVGASLVVVAHPVWQRLPTCLA